jgi:catechol 2,3-dioxygenase-like lactoylglutathione lyase family enzyme/predicted enzyme related to lactoylglutathione lyase
MRLPALTFITAFIAIGSAAAQTATLPYDHVHLAAPDQAKAVEWYQKNFGGETTPEGKDRLLFGKTRFIWLKSETAQPSANTAIDHIGLSFADLDAKMKEWEAVGVKVITPLRPVPGLVKIGFIEDPWGVKIEVVQDTETLGFHHVHLRSPDPAASMAWYKQRFGGETAKLKGLLDGLKYGDVWVLFAKGGATPSVGHALDHVGWRVANLDKTLDDLKGIKVLQGVTPLQLATGPVRFSFVEDPSGTKIELVQR